MDWILGRSFEGGGWAADDMSAPGELDAGEYFLSDDDKAALRALDEDDAASMAALEQEGADALGRVLRTAARSQAQSVVNSPIFAAELERRRALAKFALCVGSLLQDRALLLCARSQQSRPPPVGALVACPDTAQ